MRSANRWRLDSLGGGVFAAHSAYVAGGLLSSAVYGLSVGEFGTQGVDCRADPIEEKAGQSKNVAHSVADFSPHKTSQQKNIAKRLKLKAISRGRLHPPESKTMPNPASPIRTD
jgi:hypothetical protein